jgi:glycosyltransferase involved in cell wall biosynthesis
MKILVVHDVLGGFAGAEQNILLTMRALQKRGHEIYMLHDRETEKDVDIFRALFTKTYKVSFSLKSNKIKLELAAVLSELKPDMAYVHKVDSLSLLEALSKAALPVVRMIHDHDSYCLRRHRYSPYTRKICTRPAGLYCIFPCMGFLQREREGLLPFSFKSLSKIQKEIELNKTFEQLIVATPYMKEQLMIQKIDEELISVFAPVPENHQEAAASTFSDDNIILFAGQIIRGKGVDILINSLAKVKTKFKAYIMGDGSQLGECRDLADKLNFKGQIEFCGWVPNEDMQTYYEKATLLAVSSTWPEPFGAVGLEAYRHSVPVVGFDSGGISDWLLDGETGLLIEWKNEDAFAAAIDRLLSDKPLAKQLGQKGKEYGSEKYDFQKYIDTLEMAFRRF